MHRRTDKEGGGNPRETARQLSGRVQEAVGQMGSDRCSLQEIFGKGKKQTLITLLTT